MPAWHTLIRTVPDFPAAGVAFSDITPVLADATGFADCIDAMVSPWRDAGIEAVAGIEARGFILGAAVAHALGAGFVPIRKPGKLPGTTLQVEYALEYGTDRLEMHADALGPGRRVLLVDDVLATGGTLCAAARLLERLEADLVGAAVLVEIASLAGRARWSSDAPLRAALTS
ncbi:adenine phosphoribosyltransferase [Luteimonas abyssi]|uniref:adenine phosphoribosyltransferase n=1 Tax=Luteimonas abyssi TaxID=1247514 RepID=UPI000737B8EB|nr:adenine phosphoribosyltransferase [Luteimonas abyssi]